jgi:hypothetical protein
MNHQISTSFTVQSSREGKGGKVHAAFEVVNTGEASVSLPIWLISDPDGRALEIRDAMNKRLDPAGFVIVNRVEIPSDESLPPGAKRRIEVSGSYLEINDGSILLSFGRTKYKLRRSDRLSIGVRWGDLESNREPLNFP